MAWSSNYECKNCGHHFAWPRWKGNSHYLMPDGRIFRMETEIGWCEECARPSHFESFKPDDSRRQTLLDQQKEAAALIRKWSRLRRCLFSKKYAQLLAQHAAYGKLIGIEVEREKFLASRNDSHCLDCGGIAMPDAFDSSKWFKCRKCHCTMDKVDPGIRFHIRYRPQLYDRDGRHLDLDDSEISRLLAESDVMKEAGRTVGSGDVPAFLRRQKGAICQD